jgi:hypothetical protein
MSARLNFEENSMINDENRAYTICNDGEIPQDIDLAPLQKEIEMMKEEEKEGAIMIQRKFRKRKEN